MGSFKHMKFGLPQRLKWVRPRHSAALPGTSVVGGEADQIGAKADVQVGMSAVGGRADVPATWPLLPGVANNGHSSFAVRLG